MELNDLLRLRGFDPKRVIVLRHRPLEPALRKAMPWLAAERPAVFNAYQQTQTPQLENSMDRLTGDGFVVSLLGTEPARALFVGMYAVTASRLLTYDEYWAIPAHDDLKELGVAGWSADDPRTERRWFDLEATDFYAEWKGKLVLRWPPPERSWWRRADRNSMPVQAVLDESALTSSMPEWRQMEFSWAELQLMPTRWKTVLSQWRGIYYIFDRSDNRGYVGSAYGASNLLGRWQDYADRGHGGNVLLRERNPRDFSFTILQRVSPDMDPADVIRIEASWKDRLHTREPVGLNDN